MLQFGTNLDQQREFPPSGRKDDRSDEINAVPKKDVVTIYTEYDVAKEIELDSRYFQFTEDKDTADFLLLPLQVKNFLTLPVHQRVNQFPYEGALVRKVRIITYFILQGLWSN
jgi:hypothetical protein